MTQHFQRDLEGLKKSLLRLGARVEEAIQKATAALVDRRPELAEEVRRGDPELDEMEVEIESECLKIMALHQPVAGDLRFLVTALKVNNDLERMGDLAVNLAARAVELARSPSLPIADGFQEMVAGVRGMVKGALDALVERDTGAARRVLAADDAVDAAHRGLFARVEAAIREDPAVAGPAIRHLSASRYLERIADLATNIAEDVIFMVEGEIVRHRPSP